MSLPQIPSLSDVWQKCILQPLEASKGYPFNILLMVIYSHILVILVSIPLSIFHKEECDESLVMVYRYVHMLLFCLDVDDYITLIIIILRPQNKH